jgi:hypothetical protein
MSSPMSSPPSFFGKQQKSHPTRWGLRDWSVSPHKKAPFNIFHLFAKGKSFSYGESFFICQIGKN